LITEHETTRFLCLLVCVTQGLQAVSAQYFTENDTNSRDSSQQTGTYKHK